MRDYPEEELASLVALAWLPGMGPATLLRCLHEVGPSTAWRAASSGRLGDVEALASFAARQRDPTWVQTMVDAARSIDPAAYLDRHRSAAITIVVHGQRGYPDRLLNDEAAPALLFVDGTLDPLDGPVVAIVGTRNATRLGCDTAAALAQDLASCGVAIASGLALGIDGAAHRAIVGESDKFKSGDESGRPVAVVATGLDRAYPRRHALLQRQVASRGAVVSESPFGIGPLRWRFPARNRILAALADAVVVVESRSAGGSMLTVAEALRRDVQVLAVPGHPTSPAAAGTLDLICDGAIPVRDAEDVLVALGLGGKRPVVTESRAESGDRLAPLHAFILDALAAGPLTLAQLVEATGRALPEVSTALISLETAGHVTRSGSWFEPRASAPRGRARGRSAP